MGIQLGIIIFYRTVADSRRNRTGDFGAYVKSILRPEFLIRISRSC